MKTSVKNKIKSSSVKRNLEIGKKVELEHKDTIKKIIGNKNIPVEKAAELIAKDHIKEMPDYYDKLMIMESDDWVEKIKDMRSEIKEIILNDGTVVKGEKMIGGGKSGEEFAESVNQLRSQIKKIILHDGTEIPGKKIMEDGGYMETGGGVSDDMKILNLKTDLPYRARKSKNYEDFVGKWNAEYEKYKRLSDDVFYKHRDEAKSIMNAMHSVDKKHFFDYHTKASNGGSMETGGKTNTKIPDRYKQMGFTHVGHQLKSSRPEKKWMVLAKKGDQYKVVHGGQKGMKDFSQHHSETRRRRFWSRMGGENSEHANDPFSPLYWHKKYGTWEDGGSINDGGESDNKGIDLFEDYENIPSNVQKILDKYEEGFNDGDYDILTKAKKELEKIGYTFEYYLDGVAYDLRKIGEIGKVEYAEKHHIGLIENGGSMASGDKLHSIWLKEYSPHHFEFIGFDLPKAMKKKYTTREDALLDARKYGVRVRKEKLEHGGKTKNKFYGYVIINVDEYDHKKSKKEGGEPRKFYVYWYANGWELWPEKVNEPFGIEERHRTYFEDDKEFDDAINSIRRKYTTTYTENEIGEGKFIKERISEEVYPYSDGGKTKFDTANELINKIESEYKDTDIMRLSINYRTNKLDADQFIFLANKAIAGETKYIGNDIWEEKIQLQNGGNKYSDGGKTKGIISEGFKELSKINNWYTDNSEPRKVVLDLVNSFTEQQKRDLIIKVNKRNPAYGNPLYDITITNPHNNSSIQVGDVYESDSNSYGAYVIKDGVKEKIFLPSAMFDELKKFVISQKKPNDGGKTPEIKGIGKFVPITKILEVINYFDAHKKPNAGEDAGQAEGYAWIDTITKYSVLGDSAIPEKILADHEAGKHPMDIHKEIKKMEDGGDLSNFADSNKIHTFTNKSTKDEIRNVISGTGKITSGDTIQAAAGYLRRSQSASEMAGGVGFDKKAELKRLTEFINENKLWVDVDLSKYTSSGFEQQVYLKDDKTVLKLSNAVFYSSWLDYFHNLLLHNYFFPSTAYSLLGFYKLGYLILAVVQQPFIKATKKTNLDDVNKFMSDNGFMNIKKNDYYNENLGISIDDLHSENVLTRDDALFFIDTIFLLDKNVYKDIYKDGGSLKEVEPEIAHAGLEILSENPELLALKNGGEIEIEEYFASGNMFKDIISAINNMNRHVNEWSVRDTLKKFTEWGFYKGNVMVSIDEETARDIIRQLKKYVNEIEHNKYNLNEVYEIVHHYVKLEDGGRASKNNIDKELLEQSSLLLENRYLQGRIDENEYKQRLEDIKTYAKKHNIEFEDGGKITIKKGDDVKIPYDLTTNPYNKRGETGKVVHADKYTGTVSIIFNDGTIGLYDQDAINKMQTGGKTNKQPQSLYFPDDKLDYTNEMLIKHGWTTVGGRIEDFYETLKNKGREKAYKEIKSQYGEENSDDVYRSLLVLERLKQMGSDTSGLYHREVFPEELKSFERKVTKRLSQKGEHTHYLMSKPVLQWDNYDYANYMALSIKHKFADGGAVEKDTIKQLIADGFINEDHTLTNKGRRIADLHKFCFPIGAHPFSYVQYKVEDLYSKPQYVLIDDTIYYTDGFLVYELGGHLTEALRDTAVQNHNLENSLNKTISKNLTEYSPYAYCPGISIDEKVNAGEGFIVFNNFVNSNAIYVNAFLYSYIIRNYHITNWMADPNSGSLIHAVNNGITQAILMVNANAVGVNPAFTLFERDKLMGELRNNHTELFIKGRNYKDFIGEWKQPSEVPDAVKKPADIENTIRGLEVLLEMSDDQDEIKQINQEIYKLKSLLK